MGEIFLSVSIVTRKRINFLQKGLQLFADNTSRLDDIEFLLAIDDDDDDTISNLNNLPKNLNIKPVIGKRLGYENINAYYYNLLRQANGQFLFFISDDFYILTKNWDMFIRKHRNQICIIFPEVEMVFVCHRKIIEIYADILNNGRISEHYAIDHIYKYIAISLGIYARYSAIKVDWKFLNGSEDALNSESIDNRQKLGKNAWMTWKENSPHLEEVIEKLRPMVNPELFVNHVPSQYAYFTCPPLSPKLEG